jgi:hypothetical protein
VAELEQQLTTLGAGLDWPPTPDLAGRIHLPARRAVGKRRWETYLPARRGAIHLPASRGGGPQRRWGGASSIYVERRWTLAAVAVLIALAALAAYPPSRDAIANWLNVHTSIQRVPHLATPSPQPPGPLGERLGLGGRTTLAGARKQVAWPIALPSSLGQPDEVYLQLPPDGPLQGEVTLVYSSRPDIPISGETGVAVLVTEARGAVDTNFFGKMLGPGTTLEDVAVAGHQGYWIAGAPNVFFFTDVNGDVRNETMRLATNTLILDEGGTVVRIEGNLTKAQALQVAASLG